MLALLAAAALAAPDPEVERDLRCLAVFAVAGSRQETMSPEERIGVTGAMMYYLGRIEAKQLDFVLGEQLRALLGSPAYAAQIREDAARCGTEMESKGAALLAMGEALQQSGAGKPEKAK